ncbi:HNH endonuclease signature motif containing protein [Phytoactinopolyspora limicola]|uniref:HNH endonuclease signature motif containing protein n=1 Tax=Phytoactinopolyspora limicola TaxID=2715536 RepID=UPI001407C21A|nr:HNH endonuclease signature motif containing protein [Phytoactinopolyspora limicola]
MVADTLVEMVAAVKEFAVAPVTEVSSDAVVDELVVLRRLADVAEAAYLTRLREFDQRGLAQTRSVLSTRGWVRHELHVAPGETSRVLKVAKRLVDLPVIEAALLAGEIRLPHAVAIADAATLLGVDVIAGCQDALVEADRGDDPTRLRAALRGLGAAVDNTNAVRRAERRDQGRWLQISATFDGAVAIDGVLPGGDESAGIVTAALDALAKPSGADDERSPAQRRADALVELCRRHLTSGTLPARAGEPTQVIVTVGLDSLQADTGGFGELPDGSILRGDTARRLACDATITRIIVGPDSHPLDVGRTQRTATAAQRKALRLRDGGCRFPGCDRPFEWTDAHHIHHWAHGGTTNLANLISLCRKHHTAVHEGGWTILIRGPNQITFINPDGCPSFSRPRSTSGLVRWLYEELQRARPVRYDVAQTRVEPPSDDQLDAA